MNRTIAGKALSLAWQKLSGYKREMSDEFDKHKEPEEIFLPLTEYDYADLYDIEMGCFNEDIHFYLSQCSQGRSILELGCGEARISRAFAVKGFHVTAIDLSLAMLRRAKQKESDNIDYICMDMTALAFSTRFDHILIPYNTLNLLRTKDSIHNCLKMCQSLLNPGGSLLLQVHCLDTVAFAEHSGKIFQFQMLPQKKGKAKIIKETLRSYHPGDGMIILEERYRVRPHNGYGTRKDLHHILHLAALTSKQWQKILRSHSFSDICLFADYKNTPYLQNQSSLLLIRAGSAA